MEIHQDYRITEHDICRCGHHVYDHGSSFPKFWNKKCVYCPCEGAIVYPKISTWEVE